MGGFRMRKSIKVAPGVRLNVSKRGIGMSAGAGGVRYTIHSSGRRTTTVRSGIPGIYHQSSHGESRRSGASRTARPAAPRPVKPGLFAPKGEKQLYKAWMTQNPELAQQAGEQDPRFKLPAFTLAGLMLANTDGDRALSLLEQAFTTGDPADTPFFKKYTRNAAIELQIADGVTAQTPLARDAVGLTLAELYQSNEKLDQAIDIVEQLEPTTYTAVSLAELYTQAGKHTDLIELTEGIKNEDDASALLLIFRGVAFREHGYYQAAHESFKEALRSRSREPAIRHHGLLERARNYQQQGKKALARKDLERILAEDTSYPGIREQLDTLDT